MKKFFSTVIVGLIFGSITQAQSTNPNDLEIIQSVFGKDKKELIDVYMGLNNDAASAFWPIYDEYEAKRKELVKERLINLAQYIDGYSTLTNDGAANIVKQSFKNEKNIAKLHKKYFCKMKKTVGALNATKFLQMETYIQKMVELELMDDIPFIGEMEELKKQ